MEVSDEKGINLEGRGQIKGGLFAKKLLIFME
jgi:hypothetical protein